MADLAIQPHSRRDSRLAVLALGLVALGSFAAGVARQVVPAGLSPFPHTSLNSLQRASEIPVAAPAPTLQVAEAEPRPARHVTADPQDTPPDISAALPPPLPAPATATGDAASDTAAVAADQPAASATNPDATPPI
jgi:hypothetical protein